MSELKGKIAVVTGASRANGIGAAVCLSLAQAGADIFFTHWRTLDETEGNGVEKEFPEQLHQQILDLGVSCYHNEYDLSRPEAPSKLMNEVESTLGSARILVNIADAAKLIKFLQAMNQRGLQDSLLNPKVDF